MITRLPNFKKSGCALSIWQLDTSGFSLASHPSARNQAGHSSLWPPGGEEVLAVIQTPPTQAGRLEVEKVKWLLRTTLTVYFFVFDGL